ncbi:DNA-binding response regulator [Limosilactobacillus reuteri]|uniref:Response regulator n=3 Tax=Limosilactobacillus reuteri TaxID=1598 RepID=A0A2T5Q1T3_LIMRT|nr:response regulator transcription factor [Limosilactobacillus reuteri]MCW3762908.1 response regulator transcription factor [Weissella confusa]EDX43299.1 two component transcriptional regulator, winged helix family [Limosilactobacillus reuteri subsp. rodentium]MCC4372198.1 response regulator transcription factor [Limosilactobacillus reuteri]MCC4476045.1 response regulator transcription factor [Limosilactobacillus reuteri]MCR1863909.1 response regulator transcription factor [Limosilactobacillu
MKKAVIMLVEDEESLASFLITELELEGYEVIWAKDGREALEIFKEKDITLILLDWMLPIYDGLTVLRRIRQSSNVPIIMITARSQTSDISMALDQGLDDYITKPFEIEELLARIRVVLRRLGQKKAEKYDYKFRPFEINLLKHQFMVDGKRVHLTPKEFSLMVALIKEPGVVQTRDDLLNEIWGYDFDGQTNTVDVYIRALRNKLGKYRDLIKTVRGIGYVLGDEQ